MRNICQGNSEQSFIGCVHSLAKQIAIAITHEEKRCGFLTNERLKIFKIQDETLKRIESLPVDNSYELCFLSEISAPSYICNPYVVINNVLINSKTRCGVQHLVDLCRRVCLFNFVLLPQKSRVFRIKNAMSKLTPWFWTSPYWLNSSCKHISGLLGLIV